MRSAGSHDARCMLDADECIHQPSTESGTLDSSDMSSAYGVWESKIWSLALARTMESVCGSKDYVELQYDGAQGWRLALALKSIRRG